MPKQNRWLALCAIQMMALAAQSSPASSQEAYPARSIKMVVPYVAGGGTDTSARIFGQYMSARLGQQVVIENVGGAGGVVGTGNVARAQPDGYTVLYTSQAPLTVAPFLKQKPPSYGSHESSVAIWLGILFGCSSSAAARGAMRSAARRRGR
jgi:tripartite-type tricarboxylate transporter receptor subunit TctC